MEFYSSMASWQPERPDKVLREINEVVEEPQVEEDVIMEPKTVIEVKSVQTGLSLQDEKMLALIEFAYEELTRAKTHEDFVISMQMLRKIMNRY